MSRRDEQIIESRGAAEVGESVGGAGTQTRPRFMNPDVLENGRDSDASVKQALDGVGIDLLVEANVLDGCA